MEMTHDDFLGKLNILIPKSKNYMLAGLKKKKKKKMGIPGNKVAQAAGAWELNP